MNATAIEGSNWLAIIALEHPAHPELDMPTPQMFI
jgi:hypothetical protein